MSFSSVVSPFLRLASCQVSWASAVPGHCPHRESRAAPSITPHSPATLGGELQMVAWVSEGWGHGVAGGAVVVETDATSRRKTCIPGQSGCHSPQWLQGYSPLGGHQLGSLAVRATTHWVAGSAPTGHVGPGAAAPDLRGTLAWDCQAGYFPLRKFFCAALPPQDVFLHLMSRWAGPWVFRCLIFGTRSFCVALPPRCWQKTGF